MFDVNQELGSLVDAGLPNIKGSITSKPKQSVTDYYEPLMPAKTNTTGALSTASKHFSTGWAAQSGDGIATITLDASKSSSIYGNSTTVQPPAYTVTFFRRIS